MSPIPFVDLKTQYARLKPAIDARIQAVLDHGKFIMGPEVAELEQRLAAFAGCDHAVGVSSGTDALLIALMAEGIGPGDAVFLPSFSFTATPEVVAVLGATPVFVDIDLGTFNIDPADLERRVEETTAGGELRPRAIMAVDLFGLPADYPALQEIARHHEMLLLADAAQSFGASLDGTRVGALAPVTATSFFPAKPLGCYGDGGAILTDDAERAETMRSIRLHGRGREKYEVVRLGLNGRLDTLQAAILLGKLEVFGDELEARAELADLYDRRLGNAVETPVRPAQARSAWAQYSILLDDRDAVAETLKGQGIPTMVYYPRPMHMQPAYAHHGDGPGSLAASEEASRRILSLPMHPYMDEATGHRICDALVAALER
jgi:dTDP-4-amino-4,6-dideoxygalactose transaminase